MSELIYDPNNPLSDEELDKIAKEDFDKFLEYLDSKTAYLKQFSKPLSAYHLKRFASQAKMDAGEGALTTEEIKKLQKLGEKNDAESFDEEKHKYDTDHSMWLKFSLATSTIFILIYFIFPSQLIEVVSRINIIQ